MMKLEKFTHFSFMEDLWGNLLVAAFIVSLILLAAMSIASLIKNFPAFCSYF
jgi:hypothetical protein